MNALHEKYTADACLRLQTIRSPRPLLWAAKCALSDLDCPSRKIFTTTACLRSQTRGERARGPLRTVIRTVKKHSSGCEDGDAHHRSFHQIGIAVAVVWDAGRHGQTVQLAIRRAPRAAAAGPKVHGSRYGRRST